MSKKTLLITGSSRGIGKEVALLFAKNNYNIVINANKSIDELDKTYLELKTVTSNILKINCDVSDYKQSEKMFSSIYNKFGDVDILINNAAISHFGLFCDTNPDDWQYIINNNIISVLNCSGFALKPMIKNKCGNIINISSIWGVSGASCEVLYSMTKGAINTFTKALAKEVGPSNIKVNAIACGIIDTKMNDNLTDEEKCSFVENVPLMRMGDTKDVAELCLYLASPENNYMTGQVINLDGGML